MRERGELLLLHRYPYSETSWVIKALSREEGLLSLIAKGARRQKSPFAGALEPLSYSHLVWSRRPEAELGVLIQAQQVESWDKIRKDLLKSATALLMAELPLRFRPEGEGHEEWFDLLLSGLRWLETKEELLAVESAQLVARYLLRIAAECGVGLTGNLCVRCGNELVQVAQLLGDAGGFLCASCTVGEVEPLASSLFDVMQGRSDLPLHQLEEVEELLHRYLVERLEIPLNLRSWEWLRSVRQSEL